MCCNNLNICLGKPSKSLDRIHISNTISNIRKLSRRKMEIWYMIFDDIINKREKSIDIHKIFFRKKNIEKFYHISLSSVNFKRIYEGKMSRQEGEMN